MSEKPFAKSPLAGKILSLNRLIDPAALVAAYFARLPDVSDPAQRVRFGTSGHRGSAFDGSFNEAHVLAIAQAICLYRIENGTTGPVFLGIDTHALSRPASITAIEVFAANGIMTMIDADDGFTPTPVISHAILTYNRGRTDGLADGVVLTPSHNPPQDGGFKYNPTNGGPAQTGVTAWIEAAANRILDLGVGTVRRIPIARARASANVRRHDYRGAYIGDLASVIDMDSIRASGVRIGIDPLGGASVGYWPEIAHRHGLAATIVNDSVDPTFGFMTADWDGKLRMDCSSADAMARLIERRGDFDLAIGNDPDADRHGIVTRSAGLMPPNQYLSAAIAYLFMHRTRWRNTAGIGKTMVSSSMIDRLAQHLRRPLVEVPVGFKWFVDGLIGGSLGFAGEESAGATLLRRDGSVWTTDKDGIALGLLAAEITAQTGQDPAQRYQALAATLGDCFYERTDVAATRTELDVLLAVTPGQVTAATLAGDTISARLTTASGNGAPLGGIKITTSNGWFAARPSGTERIYKIYAESFRSQQHLVCIQDEAQAIVAQIFASAAT